MFAYESDKRKTPAPTAQIVDRDRRDGTDRWIKDGATRCLYHRVRPGGERVFAVRVKHEGRLTVHTIGAWPDTKLKDARLAAAQYVNGRAGKAAHLTVTEAIRQFFEEHVEQKWKNTRSAEVYRRAIEYGLAYLADLWTIVPQLRQSGRLTESEGIATDLGVIAARTQLAMLDPGAARGIATGDAGCLAVIFKLQWSRTKSGTTAPRTERTFSASGTTHCAIDMRKNASLCASTAWRSGCSATRSCCATACASCAWIMGRAIASIAR